MRNSSKISGKQTLPLLLLFAISFSALPAQAKYGGGTGGPNDPYQIRDANHMQAIGADSNDWDKCFRLMVDIDLGSYTGDEFNLIGESLSNPFTGVFDGSGHTISNFTYTSTGTSYIGLFGYVWRGEIKDIGLIDPNLDAGTGEYVGSLVGEIKEGTVTNCYVEGGSVSGHRRIGGLWGRSEQSTITNCYSTTSVSGDWDVGGMMGSNSYGSITNCYSTGGVSGGSCVGGLAGGNFGNISDCYATGSVSGDDTVGGLVGGNGNMIFEGTITNCYSTGSVTGTTNVGGLVGFNMFMISTSFWDVNTSGQSTSAGGTGLPTAEMQMMNTFTDAGWDFENIWWILEGAGYPRLWWEEKFGGGSGTAEDPYLIYTAEELNFIGLFVCELDKHFKLMADIDLSRYTGTEFNIIGTGYLTNPVFGIPYLVSIPFTGTFDGNGFEISNFKYSCTGIGFIYCIGLFGVVDGVNAQIKNLGLKDVDIDVDPGDRIGSLIGILVNGTVIDCYTQGGSVSGDYRVGGLIGRSGDNVSICNCYTNVNVSGHADIGGLVGDTYYGIISSCYSAGNITGTGYFVGGLVGGNYYCRITNSYSTGNVYGVNWRGGFVGENRGSISNCYAVGSVPPATGSNIGGFIGYNSGTVSNAFWDIETSGQASSDGGTGKMTAEMQMMSTFTDAGWDFVGERINGSEDIWMMTCEGMSYPKLSWWQPVPGDYFCPDGVDMIDMEHLALHWLDTGCDETNDYCDWAEISNDSTIDFTDFAILADNWLAGR